MSSERETHKAHTKLLVDAAMTEACEGYNPPIEMVHANLATFQKLLVDSVSEHGWQPGLLRRVLEGFDYDYLEGELGEFTAGHYRELSQFLIACLDKDIDQRVVYEAFNEYANDEFDRVEEEYGVNPRDLAMGHE